MALFIKSKKNKKWIIKVLDHGIKKTIAWIIDDRNAVTFIRLYDKVKHIHDCIFYTDDWNVFSSTLPKDRHVIGKYHTTMIERNNSNTRHHLGRMTRRTKIVSKTAEMLDITMKIWCNITQQEVFSSF